MYKAIKITHGSSGWDGPLVVSPDDEVALAVVDCGGTARCGVYLKKKILTVNLTPVSKTGPLARFITEDLYVSDVKEANLSYADSSEIPAVPKAEEPTMQIAAGKSILNGNACKRPVPRPRSSWLSSMKRPWTRWARTMPPSLKSTR